MEVGILARKEDILRQSLLRGNLRGTSGDQGKDHVRPCKRPKLEEALKPSPVAVAIGGGVRVGDQAVSKRTWVGLR